MPSSHIINTSNIHSSIIIKDNSRPIEVIPFRKCDNIYIVEHPQSEMQKLNKQFGHTVIFLCDQILEVRNNQIIIYKNSGNGWNHGH